MTTTSLATPSPAAPAHREVSGTLIGLALFAALHVPLAFLLKASPAAATLHAVATILVGFHFALRGGSPVQVVYVGAYIVGAEVLWRGAQASVFWEGAKYSILAMAAIALLRFHAVAAVRRTGYLYSLLLLPSLVVLPGFDRTEVSFAISGSLTMGLLIAFFSRARFDRLETVRLMAFGLAPLMGLAALSAVSTLAADPQAFYVGGKVTTAGIGPNQVSAALGLGMLLATYLYLMLGRSNRALSRVCLLVAVWMGLQALLSFSRGGLWGTLGTLAVAAFFLLRSRRARTQLIVSLVVLTPVLALWLIPAVDELTHGMAVRRFQQTDLTGRDEIMVSDLRAFREHPLLGLGPGQSDHWHADDLGRIRSAHTEYTRLLAEHGSLGALAVLILTGLTLARLRRPLGPIEKSLVMALTFWTLLYMGHSAMRLAAPGFMFALGGGRFLIDEPSDRGSG